MPALLSVSSTVHFSPEADGGSAVSTGRLTLNQL